MVDHVFVYDNHSTDGSKEFLQQYTWIDVIDYDSDNKLNDYVLLDIKNTKWKQSVGKSNWVIVCDMDECLFCDNFQEQLEEFSRKNIVGVIPNMYNLISKEFPQYNKNKLLHDIVKKYYFDFWEDFEIGKSGMKSKMLMFNPNKMKETNYKVGCYEQNPICDGNIIASDNFRCYHLHDVGLYRKILRYKERKDRMSLENFTDHLSDFYLESPTKII
jgi:hypothetical protein